MEDIPLRYYEIFMIFVKTLWILTVLVYDKYCYIYEGVFYALIPNF